MKGVLVTSQRGNKSRSCCHKTQPLRLAFKCCLYSQRAADTLQRGERGKEEERREREREREERSEGVSRPVAEGLILNVLQRQCLLSSLASPLTAPASKQDLSPLPPPNSTRGRKQERRRVALNDGSSPLPNVSFSLKSSTITICPAKYLAFPIHSFIHLTKFVPKGTGRGACPSKHRVMEGFLL